MDKQAYIFFGKSGAGKGTQAKLLQDYLSEKTGGKVVHFDTGSAFREMAKKDTYTSRLIKNRIENGLLAPSFMPIWAWSSYFVENLEGDEHLVFEGTRLLEEFLILEGAFPFYEYKKPVVIFLKTSNDWSMEKLLARGRADDDADDIKRRLEWFDTEVMKTIDYTHNSDVFEFLEINGEQTIEEVHAELVAKIEALS